MNRLIEFRLQSGETIIAEVKAGPGEGLIEASLSEHVAEQATKTFEEAIDRIKPAAELITKKLSDLVVEPDEIEIEFGIKLSGELGAVIAAASVDANYVVKMKWLKSSPIGHR